MSAVRDMLVARDVPVVRDVPWWGTSAAIALPLVLVVGIAVASYLQPPQFDAINNTVSALATHGANDDWIMTSTFIVAGAFAIVAALGLRPAWGPGRFVLAVGGLGGLMVAAFPDRFGGSLSHACCAGIGFGGLALWPVIAARGGPGLPWGLRRRTGLGVSVFLAVLIAWFLIEEVTRGAQIGIAERSAGLSMCFWPAVVAVSCHLAGRASPVAAGPQMAPDRSAFEDLYRIVTSATFQSGRRAYLG